MSSAVVLLVISILCGLLVVYPFLIYPLLLRLARTRPHAYSRATRSTGSEFALFFCAYNEARALPAKIENLRQIRARYPDVELWAYSDASTDGTDSLLADSNCGVKLVRGSARVGKAAGMKAMVKQSRRPFLVFTDANVLLDADALDHLLGHYADPEVGGVCGELNYAQDGVTSTEQLGGAYWRLEEFIKSEESRSGSVMGADGSIFSVRRELYPEFSDDVQDDFTVSMAVVFAGRRLIKSTHVRAYEELVSARGLELARKVRIALRAFRTHSEFRLPERALSGRDRWCYFSHKWLRWHAGAFLAVGVIALLAAVAVVNAFAAVVITVSLATAVLVGLRTRRGPFAQAIDLLGSLAATSFGVVKARLGETMPTWTPPRES